MLKTTNHFEKLVVIGASAGGIPILKSILSGLPADFSAMVVVILHMRENSPSYLVEIFAPLVKLKVVQAAEKMKLQSGVIYFAPPGYHLHIEKDFCFSLSDEDKVQHSRPSIDVLFDSAASVFKNHVTAVILSGANEDGARGLKMIQQCGGTTLVQEPESASVPSMPLAAIREATLSLVLSPEGITEYLIQLGRRK